MRSLIMVAVAAVAFTAAAPAGAAIVTWTYTGTLTTLIDNAGLFPGAQLGDTVTQALVFATNMGVYGGFSPQFKELITEPGNDTNDPGLTLAVTIHGSTASFVITNTQGIDWFALGPDSLFFDVGDGVSHATGSVDADAANAPNFPPDIDQPGSITQDPNFVDTGGFSFQVAANRTSGQYDTQGVVATVASGVPEPAAWTTILLGLFALGGLARRRMRQTPRAVVG